MDFIRNPQAIEKKSMELIAPYLEKFTLTPEAVKVYSRMIHASGDVDYANHIMIHEGAIAAASAALKAGCDIFCDVEMVRTGINKKKLASFGGQVHCLIADERIAAEAKKQDITRSMAAMRSFGHQLDGAIIAIGNAPTALFEVMRLVREEALKPAVIIGVPVGFVGAKESKDVLAAQSTVPFITVKGNKGGSPIAASAVNALLYML
ncbi:precorrin-8X/cobalt-precorrin-8 methylmutase [Sporomusaceae bacterium BoRhaA]|uniref:precorrin-8X methylmutase n=1 Tax=Pelorhabdus rhamnosifermentans TaxID=2772457 RepID=UPI001C06013A|nr:precorrin-8X methylmutase [Pelorhabdus rhamnosifermentans]MBU2703015.1 precorrin-8X/cobalt-precorrin-8 methylmutase [Pelorhabdus rhamnosifermentans]